MRSSAFSLLVIVQQLKSIWGYPVAFSSECIGVYQPNYDIGMIQWIGLDTCLSIIDDSGLKISVSYKCVDEEPFIAARQGSRSLSSLQQVGHEELWWNSTGCAGRMFDSWEDDWVQCEGVVCDTVEYNMKGCYSDMFGGVDDYSHMSVIVNECFDYFDNSSSIMTICSESEVGTAYYDGPGCVGAMVDFADVLPHNQTECIEIVSWSVSLCTICTFCTFCTFC